MYTSQYVTCPSHVISHMTGPYLREVPHNVTPFPINLSQYVKPKWLHIKEQGLMIKKQLRQQAKILTVYLVIPTVQLKHRDGAFAIDLLPSWLSPGAFAHVSDVRLLKPHVFEAVLTDP